MFAMSDLQERIRTNVRVLMAVRGVHSQQALGELLGLGKAEISKRMSGRTKWRIEDLETLAGIFGVRPGDLLGTVTEVVYAASKISTGASTEVPRSDTTPTATVTELSAYRCTASGDQ